MFDEVRGLFEPRKSLRILSSRVRILGVLPLSTFFVNWHLTINQKLYSPTAMYNVIMSLLRLVIMGNTLSQVSWIRSSAALPRVQWVNQTHTLADQFRLRNRLAKTKGLASYPQFSRCHPWTFWEPHVDPLLSSREWIHLTCSVVLLCFGIATRVGMGESAEQRQFLLPVLEDYAQEWRNGCEDLGSCDNIWFGKAPLILVRVLFQAWSAWSADYEA